MTDRINVTFLGKVIGTAGGWDQPDTMAICFYDFIPNALGKKFLVTWREYEDDMLQIDVEKGKVEAVQKNETCRELFPSWRVFEIGEG